MLNTHLSSALENLARITIAVAVPILLVTVVVRLVMSPWFLQLEYNRPGFPPDAYGFSQQDRLQYAPATLTYLLSDEPIEFLAQQTLPSALVPPHKCIPVPDAPDACYMYNDRELRHMYDVKVVTIYTYRVGIAAAGAAIISAVFLARTDMPTLRSGLISGGGLTLGIIGTIILLAATAWDVFFTQFHSIFFEGDSWLFAYEDTLIRLFPEQFWFDAAVTVGGLSALGAVLILVGCWRWSVASDARVDEAESGMDELVEESA